MGISTPTHMKILTLIWKWLKLDESTFILFYLNGLLRAPVTLLYNFVRWQFKQVLGRSNSHLQHFVINIQFWLSWLCTIFHFSLSTETATWDALHWFSSTLVIFLQSLFVIFFSIIIIIISLILFCLISIGLSQFNIHWFRNCVSTVYILIFTISVQSYIITYFFLGFFIFSFNQYSPFC